MAFRKRQIKEIYLRDTSVENIFIHEYMAAAPGEYVKVYLFSLMHAELGKHLENVDIAKELSMAEEDVMKAWTYWENLKAIEKKFPDPKDRFRYEVEFLSLKEQLYGTKHKGGRAQEKDKNHPLSDQELKEMYLSIEQIIGRLLGGLEPTEIVSWITDYKAAPEVIVYAYSWSVKNKKRDNHKTVGNIVKEWLEKGLRSVPLIEEHLQEVDKRHFLYKRVLKSLGFTRNATEQEKKLMDEWFDEMEYSIDKVLSACDKTSGISNPNINYVNKILRNWHEGKTGSASANDIGPARKAMPSATIHRYYEMIRKRAESGANDRKDQIYQKIPQIKEIDETLRAIGMEISRLMISASPDKKKRIDQLREKGSRLTEQKNSLLLENGFDADYMETRYRCANCGDSGTMDSGERCACFSEAQKEAELWQKKQKV